MSLCAPDRASAELGAKVDRVASSRPARPGPRGHVRQRLGRVGGERAELRVFRCVAKGTSRTSLPTPAQPMGSPLDAESRRSLPRSQPGCYPRSRFLPSGRVQVARLESRLFANPVFLRTFPWGLVQVSGHLGKRQIQTRCRFSRESGRAERSLPQPPLGLLSESRHLAPSAEA